jgi:hypothetical protein
MAYLRLIPMLAAVLLLAACGGAGAPAAPFPTTAPAAAATEAPAAAEAPAAGGAAGGYSEAAKGLEPAPPGSTDSSAPRQPAAQRLVIKNATVSLQVEAVAAAEAQVRARAEQLGGYVVSVQTSGSDASLASTIVFRVPADRFEQALTGVEGLARKVLGRTVSGDDVTEEFVDLESRLRNLEATRDRLLDLLTRATRVEDALQVNQALTDVQGQIEQIQGRMKYLRQSAAFSTITADLQPLPAAPTIVEPDSWQPLRVAQSALAGLVGFGQALASLAIVLLVWSPVWLPALLLVRWAVRRARPAPPRAPTP